MLGRQNNQPPTKAVLKSEANLTLDRNAQCHFLFTHWSTQIPGQHGHPVPKPQTDFGKPRKIMAGSQLTTESMQRCKSPISTGDTVRGGDAPALGQKSRRKQEHHPWVG